MASKRENVTLSGHLVGMGRDVACRVRVVKVSLPGTAEYNYILRLAGWPLQHHIRRKN